MEFSEAERDLFLKHLEGGQAFISLPKVLDNITFGKLGKKPAGLPYSFFQIFWHMVYAQKDILEYTLGSTYENKDWPEAYWPEQNSPDSLDAWEALKNDYFQDLQSLKDIISNTEINLSSSVKNSNEHSYFRELMLVIEHNSYHTGQLVILERLLNEYSS